MNMYILGIHLLFATLVILSYGDVMVIVKVPEVLVVRAEVPVCPAVGRGQHELVGGGPGLVAVHDVLSTLVVSSQPPVWSWRIIRKIFLIWGAADD